jgi:hypothetical protein
MPSAKSLLFALRWCTHTHIRLIKKVLADRPQNLAIFTLGINTNLRASDLLPITVDQVCHLKAGEHFTIREVNLLSPSASNGLTGSVF